jgi:hypothetical protein
MGSFDAFSFSELKVSAKTLVQIYAVFLSVYPTVRVCHRSRRSTAFAPLDAAQQAEKAHRERSNFVPKFPVFDKDVG